MNAVALKPGRSRRAPTPIYGRVRELVDPENGELIGALVPSTATDKAQMRHRKYKTGDVLRMELRKPRNPKFHRLIMKLCALVAENSDIVGTEAVLTILKIKTGMADPVIDSATGKTYWHLRSIAFDAMDEGEFQVCSRSLCKVIARDYFPGWTPEQVLHAAEMMPDD